jgi:hypothetical protein
MMYRKLETAFLFAGLACLSTAFLFGLPVWLVFTGALYCHIALGFQFVSGKWQLGYIYGLLLAGLGVLQFICQLPWTFGGAMIALGIVFFGLQFIEKTHKNYRILDHLVDAFK